MKVKTEYLFSQKQGQADDANEKWARFFTEHYGEIARRHPIYEELFEYAGFNPQINIHYTRKENQLFPMLEAHHFTGPSQVMWSIHDDIRQPQAGPPGFCTA